MITPYPTETRSRRRMDGEPTVDTGQGPDSHPDDDGKSGEVVGDAPSGLVYGRAFWSRYPYVRENYNALMQAQIIEEMFRLGYDGPPTLGEIEKDSLYPVKNLMIYNQACVNLMGIGEFEKMARESVQKKGLVSTMARWAGTPERALEKAPESWKKFYAFGKMETEITGEHRGIIRVKNGKVDRLFCTYLTHYFEGIGDIINYDLDVRHTKCACEGADCDEWVITWGGDASPEAEEEMPPAGENIPPPPPSVQVNPAASVEAGTDAGLPVETGTAAGPGLPVEAGPAAGPPVEVAALAPREIFDIVVSEFEVLIGDILAKGIIKKSLEKVGASEDTVTETEMIEALHRHAKPALYMFMSQDSATDCVKVIVRKFVRGTGNAG